MIASVLILAVLFCALPLSAAANETDLLLTVSSAGDVDRDAYLHDIASGAGAVVVKVYAALSLGPDDPILLVVRPQAEPERVLEILREDVRVLSVTPNRRIRAL
jgi:hypothetical protein